MTKGADSYGSIHTYLNKTHGKASHCSNKDCKHLNPKRFEWALIRGRAYSKDVNDYIQLCPSCHRKYDYTEDQKRKCSMTMKGKCYHNRERLVMMITSDDHFIFSSIQKAANETKITRTAISNCLSGDANTAGGFKWKYRL